MSAVLKPLHTAADPLADAVSAYVAAKRDEERAKKARIEAEERILALQPAKEEGATTIEAGGFKLTLTGKLTYSCDDPKALAEACVGLGWPENLVPVKTSVELDSTGAKWLRANKPDLWAQIALHITVKPAKTAVAVKV